MGATYMRPKFTDAVTVSWPRGTACVPAAVLSASSMSARMRRQLSA
jgi:hypothetical protein